jgi:hypothetical protein
VKIARYPQVSAASSNLGGRLATGITAMSRICDSGRGSGTATTGSRPLADVEPGDPVHRVHWVRPLEPVGKPGRAGEQVPDAHRLMNV